VLGSGQKPRGREYNCKSIKMWVKQKGVKD